MQKARKPAGLAVQDGTPGGTNVPPRGCSSSVERSLHTREVAGAAPASPTIRSFPKTLDEPDLDPSVEGRFWSYVDVRDLDDCWEWDGAKGANGYGRFKAVSYTSTHAHRLAYYFFHKVWPQDICVCHTCDNRTCCNPHHLFLGSIKDNSEDMVRKGRWRGVTKAGSANGAAKLNEAVVLRMRAMMRDGATNKAIAEQFDVHHATVSLIRRGKSWKHVGGPVTAKYGRTAIDDERTGK